MASLVDCITSLNILNVQHINRSSSLTGCHGVYDELANIERNLKKVESKVFRNAVLANIGINKKLLKNVAYIPVLQNHIYELEELKRNKEIGTGEAIDKIEKAIALVKSLRTRFKTELNGSISFKTIKYVSYSYEQRQRFQKAHFQIFFYYVDLALHLELPVKDKFKFPKDIQFIIMYKNNNELITEYLQKLPLLIFSLDNKWHNKERLLEGFKNLSKVANVEAVDWEFLKSCIAAFPELLSEKEFILSIIHFEGQLNINIEETSFINDQEFIKEAVKKSKKFLAYLSKETLNNMTFLSELIKENPEYILEEEIETWKNVLDSEYANSGKNFGRFKKDPETLIEIALEKKPELINKLKEERISRFIKIYAVLEGYLEYILKFRERDDYKEIFGSMCVSFFIYQSKSTKINTIKTLVNFFSKNDKNYCNKVVIACLKYLEGQNIHISDFYAKQNKDFSYPFLSKEKTYYISTLASAAHNDPYKYTVYLTVFLQDIQDSNIKKKYPLRTESWFYRGQNVKFVEVVAEQRAKQYQTLEQMLEIGTKREELKARMDLFHEPLVLDLEKMKDLDTNDKIEQLRNTYLEYCERVQYIKTSGIID